MTPMSFIAGALATWRLAQLIVSESGPYEVVSRFRHWAGVRYDQYSRPYGTTELSKLIACVLCLSFWVGPVVALFVGARRVGVVITHGLAFSAVAILIHKWLDLQAQRLLRGL